MPKRNRCQGTSRQTKKPCKAWATEGRDFCRFHGGAVPTGPNHWNWKGGRYSRFAPNRYLRAVTEALDDPNLTSLRESIALIDARLVEELQGLDSTGSQETWKELADLAVRVEVEVSKGEDCSSTAMQMVQKVRDGVGAEAKWEGLMDTIERRARLAEREKSRERDQKAYMTADQVLEFTTRLVEIVGSLIDDRRVFQSFLDQIQATPAIARLPGKKALAEPIEAEIVP